MSLKKQLQEMSYNNSRVGELVERIVKEVKDEAQDGNSYIAIIYVYNDEIYPDELPQVKNILEGEGYELNVVIRENENWILDDLERWRLTVDWLGGSDNGTV